MGIQHVSSLHCVTETAEWDLYISKFNHKEQIGNMFKHRDRAIKGVDWIEPQDIIGNIKVGMGFKKKKKKLQHFRWKQFDCSLKLAFK